MAVLQLTPLCRRLREEVEGGQVLLEDSVGLLEDASFLVLAKIQWLLPQSTIGQPELAGEELPDESLEYEEDLFQLLEESEFTSAVENIAGLMRQSQAAYSRGYVTPIEGTSQAETAAIDVVDLFDIMESLKGRIKAGERKVVVLKRNFSDHMRWFWKEITRLTSRYAVLRFSLFVSSSKQDSILNFLVLLELVKRRRVFAKQLEVFGDIVFSTRRDVVGRMERR
ncbi:MAG TPA: hypothetical protein GX524_08735 [Firmicutes bacterium]|jgi:chromatin segregation and condensation protein Rec8/ScpA/Scc1 (kleisin family)|nr:hypothetical protein [Bacillota bacterium]